MFKYPVDTLIMFTFLFAQYPRSVYKWNALFCWSALAYFSAFLSPQNSCFYYSFLCFSLTRFRSCALYCSLVDIYLFLTSKWLKNRRSALSSIISTLCKGDFDCWVLCPFLLYIKCISLFQKITCIFCKVIGWPKMICMLVMLSMFGEKLV